MKKLKLNLALNLLKKDFLIHKSKKSFFILNYDFIIKSIKQFIRLRFLIGLPIYIVSKEKRQNIILKRYLYHFLLKHDIKIVEYPVLTKESVCIFLNSQLPNHKNLTLDFKLDSLKEQTEFNFYKIFVDLSNLKKLLFIIILLRRIYEKI